MKLEIEMKARVADRGAVEAALDGMARRVRSFEKSDAYYLFPGAVPGQGKTFRVRRDRGKDGGMAIVTWKERSREGGLEVNREHEFRIGEPDGLIGLCAAMGAREYFTKRKSGQEYRLGGLCIELVEVPPLGTFLEVEKVVDASGGDADKAAAESAKAEILSLFASCGLSADDVEERYYSQMLRDSGAMAWEPDAPKA